MLLSAQPASQRLTRVERALVWSLLLVVVGVGALTLQRSAFLTQRRTDADVFFRAAWAIRTDRNVYTVHDTNEWHYHYPVLLAVLMQPLGQPPPPPTPPRLGPTREYPSWADAGEPDPPGTLPYPVAVVIWYLVTVGALWVGLHWLARAVEESTGDRPSAAFSRRWWALRLWPLVFTAPAVIVTVTRGQVNTLLLMMLAGMVLCAVRGRSFWAGVWLAGAIVLKFMPAFLLLYPLWRRDWRWLLGVAAGLGVLGLVIPGVAIGWSKTLAYHDQWVHALVLPAVGLGEDTTRDKELLGTLKSDNQTPLGVIFRTVYLLTPAGERPMDFPFWMKLVHLGIGGAMVLATMWAGGLWKREARRDTPLLLGLLVMVNLFLLPICQSHYYVLHAMVAAPLMDRAMRARGETSLSPSLVWPWGAYLAGTLVPKLPWVEEWKYLGMAMMAAMVLWMVGARTLRRERAN